MNNNEAMTVEAVAKRYNDIKLTELLGSSDSMCTFSKIDPKEIVIECGESAISYNDEDSRERDTEYDSDRVLSLTFSKSDVQRLVEFGNNIHPIPRLISGVTSTCPDIDFIESPEAIDYSESVDDYNVAVYPATALASAAYYLRLIMYSGCVAEVELPVDVLSRLFELESTTTEK